MKWTQLSLAEFPQIPFTARFAFVIHSHVRYKDTNFHGSPTHQRSLRQNKTCKTCCPCHDQNHSSNEAAVPRPIWNDHTTRASTRMSPLTHLLLGQPCIRVHSFPIAWYHDVTPHLLDPFFPTLSGFFHLIVRWPAMVVLMRRLGWHR